MTLTDKQAFDYSQIVNSMVSDLDDWAGTLSEEHASVEHHIVIRLCMLSLLGYASAIAIGSNVNENEIIGMLKTCFADVLEKSPKWGE